MARPRSIFKSANFETDSSMNEKVKGVRQLLQKDGPLSKHQADFCDDSCVERYLRARGYNVRRAARLLKSTLNWRESIDIGYLIADEFPAELAAGAAYVAGLDDEGRPVLVIKKKPDYINNHTHKRYLRYVIFTMEVAVAAMPTGVDQWILILDGGGYSRRSSLSPSGILTTLKILADHYPERLAKAFIVDASPMFYYVWKGICTFVDHTTRGKLSFAYLKDYKQVSRPLQGPKPTLSSSPYNQSWRHGNSMDDTKIPNSIYCSTAGESPLYEVPSSEKSLHCLEGPELMSSTRVRSFSFSSAAVSMCHSPDEQGEFSSFRKDDPNISNSQIPGTVTSAKPRRHKAPSWDGFASIFSSHKKEDSSPFQDEQTQTNVHLFRPYLKFLQVPYDEAAYRALMKPPLGGLATIISKDLKR